MDILLTLMYIIEFLVAALLVLVILVQRSKAGGGLGGLATTSSGVEEAFGSDAGNVLVKVTIILAIVFGVNTIGIGIVQGIHAKSKNTGVPVPSSMVDSATDDDEKATPAMGAPTSEDALTAPKTNTPATVTTTEEKPAEATEKPATEKPATEEPAEGTKKPE